MREGVRCRSSTNRRRPPRPAFASPRASRLCDEPHGRRTVGLGVGCSRLDHYVIDVAVAPVFSGLEGLDNRVFRVVEVCGCVLVLRFIAATYVPTRQAFPEMYPLVPGPEAFLAALRGWLHIIYLARVAAPLPLEHMHEPPHRCSPQAGRPLVQNDEPSVFKNSASSGVVSLPRIPFLWGNRPNRSMMSLCPAA